MEELSEFSKQVIRFIKAIPEGKVATYGQIAELAGKKYAARGVAWILNSSSKAYCLPWHRVLNSQGRISFHPDTKNFREQKRLLIAEGVRFDSTGKLDMTEFQWNKKPTKKKSARTNKPRMFQ